MDSNLKQILALIANVNISELKKGIDSLVLNPQVDSIQGIGNAGTRNIVSALWRALPTGSIKSAPILFRFLKQFSPNQDPTIAATRNAKLIFELISDPEISVLLKKKESEFGQLLEVVLKKENPSLELKHAQALIENFSSLLDSLRRHPVCISLLEELNTKYTVLEDRKKLLESQRSKFSTNPKLNREIALITRQQDRIYRDQLKKLGGLTEAIISSKLTGTDLSTSLEFLSSSFAEVFGKSSLLDSIISNSLTASEADKDLLVSEIKKALNPYIKAESLKEAFSAALKSSSSDIEKVFVVRSACATRLASNDLSGLTLKSDYIPLAGRGIAGFKFRGCTFENLSFNYSSLLNCDFTDLIINGSIDLSGAQIDSKTLRSLIPSLRQAKTLGFEIKINDDSKLLYDGTPIDISDTGLEEISIERQSTFSSLSSYIITQPYLVENNKTDTDYKDAVREEKIIRNMSSAIDAVQKWYLLPPLENASPESIREIVRSMNEEAKAKWSTSFGAVSFIDHIELNLGNNLKDILKTYKLIETQPKIRPTTEKDIRTIDQTITQTPKLYNALITMLKHDANDPDTRLGTFLAKKIQSKSSDINPAIINAIKKIKLSRIISFILKNNVSSTYKTIKLLLTSKNLERSLKLAKHGVSKFTESLRTTRTLPTPRSR